MTVKRATKGEARYVLTPKVAAAGRQARIEAAAQAGHVITVTGPNAQMVRAFFECSCGIEKRFASRRAANTSALAHLDSLTQESR